MEGAARNVAGGPEGPPPSKRDTKRHRAAVVAPRLRGEWPDPKQDTADRAKGGVEGAARNVAGGPEGPPV